jgi:hypothetical protein
MLRPSAICIQNLIHLARHLDATLTCLAEDRPRHYTIGIMDNIAGTRAALRLCGNLHLTAHPLRRAQPMLFQSAGRVLTPTITAHPFWRIFNRRKRRGQQQGPPFFPHLRSRLDR